jgi:hypothetical protein
MEYYQHIQDRAGQTVAVINKYIATLTVGTTTPSDLETDSQALDGLAQTRDNQIALSDEAVNVEQMGFRLIRKMDLAFPAVAEGELDEDVEAEAALLDLFDSAYGIQPRTTEAAIERGHKVVAAVTKANTYLAAQLPVRGPIASGGREVADLTAALGAQPTLEQAVDDQAAETKESRILLRSSARGVDRLSKRFYKKLQAEARDNPDLAAALSQIDTGPDLPETLGIHKVIQGGDDQLHAVVSYEGGSFTPGATNTVEWMVDGVDQDFSHSVAVDASGNALGPFTTGQTMKLRTRVTTGTGTTTGSVRSLKLLPPVE